MQITPAKIIFRKLQNKQSWEQEMIMVCKVLFV